MKTIKLNTWDGKFRGVAPSIYAKQNGYLDYLALSQIIGDCILNNSIHSATDYDDWELVNGQDFWAYDKDGNEVEAWSDEEYDREYIDVYQEYIISEQGAKFLQEYTDEIVYYNSELDIYLWGITHFGTSWSYVLTGIKIEA